MLLESRQLIFGIAEFKLSIDPYIAFLDRNRGGRLLAYRIQGIDEAVDRFLYLYENGNMEARQAVIALAGLAQETRLAIFRTLIQAGPQGMAAGRIAEALRVPAATLSFHLKELAHAGLINSRQESRFIYYSADFDHMAALMTFLTQNCCQGMPNECLTVMETALGSCCSPAPNRKLSRKKS